VLVYVSRRIVYVIPIVLSVALVCFLLVHITPGDPLVAVLPADASQELAAQLRAAYGFDRPLPVQFGLWLWRALNGDLGHSIADRASGADGSAPRGRQHGDARNCRRDESAFRSDCFFGLIAGYFRDTWVDKVATLDCDRRRVRAALLARHGAGHHLLGGIELAARGWGRPRRLRRLGMGLGAHPAT